MDQRTKSQRRKQKYREAGMCGQCGKDPVPGKKSCQRCLDNYSRYRKTRQAEGLCSCSRVREDPELKTCRRCRELTSFYHQKLRDEVFEAYGGYKCKCCGEARREFLQIDHVNNDGAAHRREIKRTGSSSLYYWLKFNGFPPGFQPLCANCNYAKAHYGYCPHQPDKEVNDAPINAKPRTRSTAQQTDGLCGSRQAG
jgi:hypothetical protein